MFPNASNFVILGGQFTLNAQEEQNAIKLIVSAFQDRYVSRATHDNNEILDPPKCRPGTFVPLLDRLSNWIKDESSPVYICWLHGPAGVGKSAITRSLAEILEPEGLLAGTFFFSREDTTRNSQKPLVVTLAQQLAHFRKETRVHIAASLLDDPAILSKSLKTQFENLIVSPIVQLTFTSTQPPSFRPALMVIDGLDECEDPMARSLILNTLCTASAKLQGMLRFLIASRDILQTTTNTIGGHIDLIEISTDMRTPLNRKPSQIADAEVQRIPVGDKPLPQTQADETVPIADNPVKQRSIEDKSPHREGLSLSINKFKSPCHAQRISFEDLSPRDAIIAVLGPTASGKSSFIEVATGITGIVGHSLESYTKDISLIKLSCPELVDSDICFIDTPGFDDTNKSDVSIFQMISDCLNSIYKRNIQLTGLLYFHRISDNRFSGTPLKNLRLFEKLCGDNFHNIVLTTTMWAEVEEEEGTCREQELKDTYWKTMINRGSPVKRFLYTRKSAFDILAPILEVVDRRNALLLQKEMTDLGMKLKETSAGKALYMELEELVTRQQTILGKIRSESKDSKLQPEELQMLMDEYRKVCEDLKKLKIRVGDTLQPVTRSIDWTRQFSRPISSRKRRTKLPQD